MFKKKKEEPKPLEKEVVQSPVIEPAFDEAAALEARRQELHELMEAMRTNGVDSLSKLEVLISQVNNRLAQLGR